MGGERGGRCILKDSEGGVSVLWGCIRRSLSSDDGATAVEYAIMAGLIAVVIAAAVGLIGPSASGFFAAAAAF